ncbi:SEL1-like repeat protein [Bosea lathyri]|uniref:Localization factor PodJL n=1 Tax=Bosea lathyri TaxID=1036778 RepID=A0A1H5T3H6_9HYPH|nr:SEL1-like repeat protein [Bosea lathyri]SEF57315.1 localization factor PodJL [Bosea lathyri]
MATSLPWSVKGVDPRTRDAAKAAARRAGMTLGEWLDFKIRDEDGAEQPAPPPEQLDIAALSERLAKLSQGQMDTSPQEAFSAPPKAVRAVPSRNEIDAVITQAASAERLTRESSAKTAGALDSIARWIEKTENRISSGERAAAERQERATSVIAEAIKTMGERIVDIERKTAEAQRAPVQPEQAPRLAFSRDGLAAAVTDIRTRQRALDEDPASRSSTIPGSATIPESRIPESRISALRDDLRELSARIAPASARAEPTYPPMRATAVRQEAQPAQREPQLGQIEAMLAELGSRLDRLDKRDRLEPIMKPLARIESEVSRLSQDRSGGGYQRFEQEIAHLAAKVDALAARGGDRTILAPVLHDIAELRDLLEAGSGDKRLEDLSQQVSSLSFEMGRLRDAQPDGRELRGLSMAIEDVRNAVFSDRAQDRQADTAPMAALSRQIEALAIKLEDLGDRRPAGELEDRIDALQQHIESLVEQGPAAVTRQIEALAGRIETLAASSNLTQLVNEGKSVQVAQVDLRPVEDMLRSLAEKIDEAGSPGAGSEAFDALEQQISGIATRLDAAAATRSAETGMERTLQDLVVHLRSLREETAAERAQRAAIAEMASTVAPASGIAELSSLMSGLRDTHVSSGRQTQDAIGAVHQTLETIISRLSSLEAELLAERQGAAPRPVIPPRAAASVRPSAPQVARSPEPMAGMSVAAGDRFVAEMPGSTKVEVTAAPAAATPVAGGIPSLDLPLEPGSGRPRTDAALAGGHDAQSIRQNLIAAARRSAKAASEAASGAPAPAAEPTKNAGRLKEIMEKRKRPLLLGLAALVLAMGTAHIVTGALKGDKTKPAGNEATQSLIAPSATPPEAATDAAPAKPAKDQASALPPTAPGPEATSVAAAETTSSTSQPSSTQPLSAQALSTPPLPAQIAPAVTPPPAVTSEPVLAATGIGELPAGLGSAGLRKAALDGNARAVYELASRAADGPAATRDLKLALRLFERAAVAGLPPAQFRLGNMFEKGTGTTRDIALARVWYMRAAERGNAKAMHNLAVLHAEGISGKPDYATATEWFRRAAELGVRDSQYNLAVLLGRGLGAPADLSQSYVWFSVAAGQGDEDAGRKRDEVAQRLTPADLATAKSEAGSWKPKALDAAANEVVAPAKGWDVTPTAEAKKPAKPARS